MTKSVATRIDSLERQFAERSHDGLPRDVMTAVRQQMHHNVSGIALERKVARLEYAKADETNIPWLDSESLTVDDLPRIKAESDANWRAWISEHHGANVA